MARLINTTSMTVIDVGDWFVAVGDHDDAILLEPVILSARLGPCRLGRGPRRDEFRPGRESVLVTVVGRRATLPGTRHHGGSHDDHAE
jgi:hypothetical protein